MEKLRLITGWDCDYCGERVINRKDYLTNRLQNENEHFFIVERHLSECKEAQKILNEIDNKKVNNFVYDNESSLKKKGYGKGSVDKLRSWGLINRVELPNLKEEKRVGVLKELSVISNLESNLINSGEAEDGIIFLVPRSLFITKQNLPNLLTENNSSFYYSTCGSKETKTYKEIITAFFVHRILKKQKNWEHNVYFLKNASSEFDSHEGSSATSALYLALLSAYHQKPISSSVTATGVINIGKSSEFRCIQCFKEKELIKNIEENFSQNKIAPVGGLEYKIPAAVKAGVKKLILSSEQQANYERVIPAEVREKLKVYYVKNVEELEQLFWDGEFS